MKIKKYIYNLGENYRNPSLKVILKFLKKSDFWSKEELYRYQEDKFIKLIHFCFDHNLFYQQRFKEKNLTKDSFNSLKDIKKIPLLEKADLIKYNDENHSKYKFKKVFKASTSGSSGESLEYYRDEESDSFSRALIQRGYSWYGIRPSDCNGYFWGFSFSFLKRISTRFFDFLQNRKRLFSYEKEELESFIRKTQNAKYLHGYSSMLYETAKMINNYKLKAPKDIKLLKGTSEKIFSHYHIETKKAFGLPIISEYGAAESGIIAFECPKGHMHIAMEGVIVEEMNNEIVVTNLHLKSFPIIRYKLGDYIELAPDDFQCSCGRKHRVIRDISGRVGSSIIGKHKRYPTLTLYYIFKNLSKEHKLHFNYQAIQKEGGRLIFYIKQKLSPNELNLLNIEIEKYFHKNDIVSEIIDNYDQFKRDGKLRYFISEL